MAKEKMCGNDTKHDPHYWSYAHGLRQCPGRKRQKQARGPRPGSAAAEYMKGNS